MLDYGVNLCYNYVMKGGKLCLIPFHSPITGGKSALLWNDGSEFLTCTAKTENRTIEFCANSRWNYDTMEEEAPIHEVYSKAKKIVNV